MFGGVLLNQTVGEIYMQMSRLTLPTQRSWHKGNTSIKAAFPSPVLSLFFLLLSTNGFVPSVLPIDPCGRCGPVALLAVRRLMEAFVLNNTLA